MNLALVPSDRRASRPVSALGHEVLRAVYTHRLLTTAQLWELVAPTRTERWLQETLARLLAVGLLGRVRVAGGQMGAWYLTPKGLRCAEGPTVEVRGYRMTAEKAADAQQEHTLSLNEAGLAFVRAARMRGDDCWPGWRNETAHRLGPGPRADVVISDAVVEYTVVEEGGSSYLTRFLELDRITYDATRLVAKLETYARLANYAPGWRLYPKFPGVVIVMHNSRLGPGALDRRMDALAQLIPLSSVIATSPLFDLSVTTLFRLCGEGPFAPIFWKPGVPDFVDIRGRVP